MGYTQKKKSVDVCNTNVYITLLSPHYANTRAIDCGERLYASVSVCCNGE